MLTVPPNSTDHVGVRRHTDPGEHENPGDIASSSRPERR